MARRGGIEDDVIVVCRCVLISQQFRKFIESCDFDGACTGQLFFDVIHRRLRKELAIGANNPFPIKPGGLFRVDVHGVQTRYPGNWGRSYTQTGFQNFVKIRSGVGTHQQNSLSPFSERNGYSTGNRSLANAALSREKKIASQIVGQIHGSPCSRLARSTDCYERLLFFHVSNNRPRLELQMRETRKLFPCRIGSFRNDGPVE